MPAGRDVATSVPMGILAVSHGDSSRVCRATGISKRPTGRSFMANTSRLTCWGGRWGRWPKAWASGLLPGCARSTRTRCSSGGVEVADHLQAFSQYFLHNVRVTQVQLDELFALLSAVKAGEVSEAEAVERLGRSPHWVWVAIDPVSKLLLTIDSGDRTLAMAQ